MKTLIEVVKETLPMEHLRVRVSWKQGVRRLAVDLKPVMGIQTVMSNMILPETEPCEVARILQEMGRKILSHYGHIAG